MFSRDNTKNEIHHRLFTVLYVAIWNCINTVSVPLCYIVVLLSFSATISDDVRWGDSILVFVLVEYSTELDC